ncbi:FICD (predicted) [Pycnogonum litorale]
MRHVKPEKALKLLQHAMALAPWHPDVLTNYGELLEEQHENIIEAEHLYTRALMINPEHSKALVNRGRTAPVVEELDQGQLSRLDRKRDILITIPEHSSAFKRMKKEAYFLQIHHTAAIEGNTLTLAQTRMIIETRMAVGGKSIVEHNEILGIDSALSYINTTLVNRIGDIVVEDILEIHRRLMGFVDISEAGKFRKTQVYVGDHIPPHPKQVPTLMAEFVSWLNSDESYKLHPVKYAALAHYKFVYIHPFTDGNGRSSRLLMNFILMRAGYPPVIIHKQDRQKYYDYLKKANEGDVRPFVRFIAECAETILDAYLYATTDLVSQDAKVKNSIESVHKPKLPKTIIEE